MIDLANLEVWFVPGSQHLYGPEALRDVEEHSIAIAGALSASTHIPVKIMCKPVMTSSDSIHQLCLDANGAKNCVGLITWMHTFSPARMWIAGLRVLNKPFLHLHTQFNKELPWSSIDMDFMNLNESAHGDREFGFIGPPVCVWSAKSWSGSGKTPQFTPRSVSGLELRAPGTMLNACKSCASGTTCGTSLSPKEIKSMPRSSCAIR